MTPDIVIGGLSVEFDVTYLGGINGERLAARQAAAIAALLEWAADRDADQASWAA